MSKKQPRPKRPKNPKGPKPLKLSKKPAFLAAYKATASVTKAAAAVGIDRGLHYDWLREDADYAAAFERAQEEAAQLLEDEAVRRAHDGVESPIVHRGQLCYPLIIDPETGELKPSLLPLMEREYSDQLLITLLKRFRPDKYRENIKAEITASDDLVERLAAARARLKKKNEEE